MLGQQGSLFVGLLVVDSGAGAVRELADMAKLDQLGELIISPDMILRLVLLAEHLLLELLNLGHPLLKLSLLELQLILLQLNLLLRPAPHATSLDEMVTRAFLR